MLKLPHSKAYKGGYINTIAPPEILHIPLTGYRDEMTPLVAAGERILKYQALAKSDGPFASVIHAPVSGIVNGITTIDGIKHIAVLNDYREQELAIAPFNVEQVTVETATTRMRDFGVEGSGGARFPASLKYAVETGTIDTLIVNGAECEPFLISDHALLLHHTEQICLTLHTLGRMLDAQSLVIAIERHNSDLNHVLAAAIRKLKIDIRLKIVPDSYPQGNELQLIKSVTGKVIPKGTIPARHGVIVSNTGTIWAIYKALFLNIPHTERVVTLFDEQTGKGGCSLIRIGTPVASLLSQLPFGGAVTGNLIAGGPMMGKLITDLRSPITKGTGGILLLRTPKSKAGSCISCGYCAEVCPQQLLPMEFARHVMHGSTVKLSQYHLPDCIECAACAYSCPSDVPLMESIRKGKSILLNMRNNAAIQPI